MTHSAPARLRSLCAISAFWAGALGAPGCQGGPHPPPPVADVPELLAPERHAPPPGPLLLPKRERPHIRIPEVATPPTEAATPLVVGPPIAARKAPATPPRPRRALNPDGAPTVDMDAARWLRDASALDPGCLLRHRLPQLDLPSPEVLAYIIQKEPRGFTGTAREALVCLLRLPQVTGAELFGATAFRGLALSTAVNLDGGDRAQGVLALGVVTEQPAGEGTVLLVSDERDHRWVLRQGLYLPYPGDATTRRLVSLQSERLTHARRRGILLREKDRRTTLERHLGLTPDRQFVEWIARPLAELRADGTRLRATLKAHGRRWPRALTWRATLTPADGGPTRFVLQELEASPNQPYAVTRQLEGPKSPAEAARLLDQGERDAADWLLRTLPRAQRRHAEVLALRARIASTKGRWRRARRYWRQASKAKDTTPPILRDYGLFLAARGRKRQARKVLSRYLDLAPNAPDRTEIEARLTDLGGHR